MNPDSLRRRRGFTLVELLVVIGVIVILAGLLIPMVIRAMRQSDKIRIQADFQSIAVALDAYRSDHGDIPRVDPAFPDTGAAVLGKALLGRFGDGVVPSGSADTSDPIPYDNQKPYDAGDMVRYSGSTYLTLAAVTGSNPSATGDRWAQFNPWDGSDGPGFRARPGQGKVYGPYVAIDKVNSRGTFLLDHRNNPIFYFPTRPGATNVSVTGAGYDTYVGRDTRSYINANDNLKVFKRLPDEAAAAGEPFALKRIQMVFGDLNCDGRIAEGEKAISQPYVLISPGNDGLLGPAGYQPPSSSPLSANQAAEAKRLVDRSDDVTNVQ